MLLYSGDQGPPLEAIEAVIEAVNQEQIPEQKIIDSVHRIAAAKKRYCNLSTPIDVTEVGKHIGLPEHFKLADAILKKELME